VTAVFIQQKAYVPTITITLKTKPKPKIAPIALIQACQHTGTHRITVYLSLRYYLYLLAIIYKF